MTQVIRYRNNSHEKYFQLKLDDGNRILVSMAQTGIKIMKLKWGGLIPSGTIFEISTPDLFSEKYKPARERLTEISMEPDFLDVFKTLLVPLSSLEEVQKELNRIFKV